MSSLTQKTTLGLKWSAIEKLCNQGLHFGIQILLARLIAPQEFGLLALIVIFTTFAKLIINSGFSQALIRKEELTKEDVSTTFFFNLLLSFLMYGVLYVSAPWVANFYGEPRLVDLLRVISITLVIAAFGIVQQALLIRALQFRRLALVSLPSLIVSGTIGIWLANSGWQVWALVAFQISRETVATISYWFWSNNELNPGLQFSGESLRSLGRFGIGILGSSLIYEGVQNIYGLLIGKFFPLAELGFYNRARTFHRTPALSVSGIMNRVMFPVFSKIQDDDKRIVSALRRGIPLLAFVMVPAMGFLMCASEDIVIVVLTAKWLPAAKLMHWFPVIGMIYPLASVSTSVIHAKGYSGLFFWLSIIKNLISISVLMLTIRIGVLEVVMGQVLVSIFSHFVINGLACQQLVGYRLLSHVADTLPYAACAAAAAGAVIWVDPWMVGWVPVLRLIAKLVIFGLCYLVICRLASLRALEAAQAKLLSIYHARSSKQPNPL